MKIPLNNFIREYDENKKSVDRAIKRVLDSGWFILGKELTSFEKELSDYLKINYSVGVANGTEAITLALLAMKIMPGDEVITTNMSAYPTVIGIEQTGAKAVLVDIDEKTGLINPDKVVEKITEKTKFIIPVHLYGQACDMEKIMKIANKYKLKVMEDCAQAIGAKFKGKFTGSFGQAASLSFYPTKNLGAYGDGGAIITNDKNIYKKLLMLRNYGQSVRYYHDELGVNSRLDEIQAAILREKLKKLNINIEGRRKIANYYDKHLRGVFFIPEIKNRYFTYHLYVVKSSNRDRLQSYLTKKGIKTLIHYPVPINRQQAFKFQKQEKFPATDKFVREILSLPIYPQMTLKEVKYIVKTINSFKG